MTVSDLLSMLNDLPIDSLDKQIMVDAGERSYTQIKVVPVADEEMNIIGYMVLEDTPVQLKLPFEDK